MSQQITQQRIQDLRIQITTTTKAITWLALGVLYLTAVICSLVYGAIAGWGLLAVLLETVALVIAILCIIRQLALWELRFLQQMPMEVSVSSVISYVPQPETPVVESVRDVPVYMPSSAVEYPGYETGYGQQV
jgi:hypothetical protein